jgi:hypothetical protein
VEAKDPLSDLADIHMPGAVSAWPPAPVWWVLAALIVATMAWAGLLLYRRRLLKKKLQVALDEINRAHLQFQSAQHEVAAQASLALLQCCNSVLKRVALVHYPETEVAALHGGQWLDFLDHSGATDAFTNGPCQVLADHSYRRSYHADAATAGALVLAVNAWVSKQYLQPRRPARAPLQETTA